MRRAVHHWQARSLTCSSADCVSAADLHVGLKLTAVQLFPEMLAQRRLANLKLSGYLGLGDAKSRSTLNKRALGIGRLIFGGHFTFPIAQPRDARALGEKCGHSRRKTRNGLRSKRGYVKRQDHTPWQW